MTFQQVIRSYAKTVLSGHSDTDLTPRQRKYTGVLLNMASNRATADYPPTTEQRERLVDYAIEVAFDVVGFLTPREAEDMNEASPRAVMALRNM